MFQNPVFPTYTALPRIRKLYPDFAQEVKIFKLWPEINRRCSSQRRYGGGRKITDFDDLWRKWKVYPPLICTPKIFGFGPPWAEIWAWPGFWPQNRAKSLFGSAHHILFRTKFLFYDKMCVSVSCWGWKKKFWKSAENWRF